MRTSSNGAWLAIGLLVVLFLVGGLARSGDTAALIVIVVITIIAINALRSYHSAPRPGGVPGWQSPLKNVTPVDPAVAPPADSDAVAEAGRAEPTVIVVEPEPIEGLEARLQALDRLKANGVITHAEYEAKRARLIADF